MNNKKKKNPRSNVGLLILFQFLLVTICSLVSLEETLDFKIYTNFITMRMEHLLPKTEGHQLDYAGGNFH